MVYDIYNPWSISRGNVSFPNIFDMWKVWFIKRDSTNIDWWPCLLGCWIASTRTVALTGAEMPSTWHSCCPRSVIGSKQSAPNSRCSPLDHPPCYWEVLLLKDSKRNFLKPCAPLPGNPVHNLSCPVWLALGPESPHQKGQMAARLPPCEDALLLNRLAQLVLSFLLARQTLFLLLS